MTPSDKRCRFLLGTPTGLVKCVADWTEVVGDIQVCAEHAGELRGGHHRSGTPRDRCAYSSEGAPTEIVYDKPIT